MLVQQDLHLVTFITGKFIFTNVKILLILINV